MLYNDKALGKKSRVARLVARLAILFSGKRYADLDLLSMSSHLRRDVGLERSGRGLRPDDVWRK